MDIAIKEYHELNYNHIEMLCALAKQNNIFLSMSTLERKLKMLNLKKYGDESPLPIVIDKINDELQTSGQLLGYRALWRRLKSTHKLNVKRETVEELLRIIDPEGVLARKGKKFK